MKKEKIQHFNSNGESLGFLTFTESLDLRYYISRNNIYGYYVVVDNIKIHIGSDGILYRDIIKNVYNNTDMSLFNKIKHSIKREYQHLVIKTHKSNTKDERIPRSEYEKEVVSICHRMFIHKSSDLMLYPDENERLVNNDELNMYILIKEKSIDIVNHTYHYNEQVCPKTMSRIKLMFDGNLTKRRQMLKYKIFSNVKKTLCIIKDYSLIEIYK